MRTSLLALCATGLALSAMPAHAQRDPNLRPSESVWQPAPTPRGGVSWQVLESTGEIERREHGLIYSRPQFTSQVRALDGRRIKVNGYMMPLQSSARQSHFVLLGYPPDCPFHLNPAPDQFIEVRVSDPIPVGDGVRTIEGTLVLAGEDESGVFYKLTNAREIG